MYARTVNRQLMELAAEFLWDLDLETSVEYNAQYVFIHNIRETCQSLMRRMLPNQRWMYLETVRLRCTQGVYSAVQRWLEQLEPVCESEINWKSEGF